MAQATAGHGGAEDCREAALKDRLAMAGQAATPPAAFATDPLLQAALQVGAVARVVHEVDVELVDGASRTQLRSH